MISITLLQNLKQKLANAVKVVLLSGEEYVIWRRQITTKQNPLSDNAFGNDHKGLYWRTEDVLVPAVVQKRTKADNSSEVVVYVKLNASPGDLFVRLVGQPKTVSAAKQAARTEYLKVLPGGEVRRSHTGEIIYARYSVIPDATGHTQEYGQTPKFRPGRI